MKGSGMFAQFAEFSDKVSVMRIYNTIVLAGLILGSWVLCAQDKQPQSEEKSLISSLNGQALYQTYCATCHGNGAKGDGPTAPILKTPPPDLTQIAARRGGAFPTRNIERIISGESELMAHGTREMPLWGPIFSQVAWDQDLGRLRVANLVKYLESIQAQPWIGARPNR
jgi:mono/diheme cytochrome c family protein